MTTKDQFTQMMETQFKEWQSQLEEVKALAEKAEANMREEYDKQIEFLKNMQDDAWDQLQKVQDASEQAWQEAREQAEKQWQDFEKQLKSFTEQFKL